jgi:hypothetical protein
MNGVPVDAVASMGTYKGLMPIDGATAALAFGSRPPRPLTNNERTSSTDKKIRVFLITISPHGLLNTSMRPVRISHVKELHAKSGAHNFRGIGNICQATRGQ